MVYLSKIYTKSGDAGQTSLGDGTRVPKDDVRIEAIGTVDELNSILGLLRNCEELTESVLVAEISNDLFDLGADLCVPETSAPSTPPLRITQEQVDRLEKAIDRLNAPLEPLKSFILPGGNSVSAWCHLARSVCRRAERRLVTLSTTESINPQASIYLNRLSDLLFVLARCANNQGKDDILWEPGRNI